MHEMALHYWLLSASLLFFKMLANSLVQGYYRMAHARFVTPEDAAAFGQLTGRALAPAAAEHPMVLRAAQCWRNDLENIPMFLLLCLGYVLAGGEARATLIYCATFVLARTLHTLFFLLQLQPWRTIAYLLGLFATLGLAVNGIILGLQSAA